MERREDFWLQCWSVNEKYGRNEGMAPNYYNDVLCSLLTLTAIQCGMDPGCAQMEDTHTRGKRNRGLLWRGTATS